MDAIKSFARGPLGDVGATEALGNVPKLNFISKKEKNSATRKQCREFEGTGVV